MSLFPTSTERLLVSPPNADDQKSALSSQPNTAAAMRNGTAGMQQRIPIRVFGKKRTLHRRWQGWLDSNQRVRESKSLALPLGYTPISVRDKRTGKGRSRSSRPLRLIGLGWVKGLEPSTPGTTIRCSNQLSYTHHIRLFDRTDPATI